jgi:hypothetical protein
MTKEQREAILKDAEMAEALYKLGTQGYAYTEEVPVVGKDGQIQLVAIKKHIPPSVEAQIFWLCNRCPDKWKADASLLALLFGQVQDQIDDFLQHKPH